MGTYYKGVDDACVISYAVV